MQGKCSSKLPFWLFVLGAMFLSYVAGAAVLFFGLPTSNFLKNAFLGAQAWFEQNEITPPPMPGGQVKDKKHAPKPKVDKPSKTFDGFTLVAATTPSSKTKVDLLDMSGKIVHSWSAPFRNVWPEATHLPPNFNLDWIIIFNARPFANGDLLVTYHGIAVNALDGCGLAKLDKDSNVIWKYSRNVHHDVDVGTDGTIYAIFHKQMADFPEGLDFLPKPCVVDYLTMLSPEGKELREPIPLLDAISASPYADLLDCLKKPDVDSKESLSAQEARRRDLMHSNHVNVLTAELATKFPMFKEGQVLVCIRNLGLIAVIDPKTGTCEWAAKGPWRDQHDAQFLSNGHILIFDNKGSGAGARAIEFDPQSKAVVWSYEGENWMPLSSPTRGMAQRLANGNTLVVASDGAEILEVTQDKEVVWSNAWPGCFLHVGRRYSHAELPFVGKTSPR